MASISRETDSPAMVSGDSIYNYSNNSSGQRKMIDLVKPKIEEVIAKKLDLDQLKVTTSYGGTFRIADLGCSIGPNTFVNVQHFVNQVKHKYYQKISNHQTVSPLEFQVFFNDQTKNDFNALFRALPVERDYFSAGVPGSFYRRLFPKSSLHFAHSTASANWLSRVPIEVVERGSPATWNKGRIHYLGAGEQVADAYRAQFEKDMEGFLRARAEELVSGGMLVLVILGTANGMSYSDTVLSSLIDCINLSILDLVREGVLSEDHVDSFNLPLYIPELWEMRELVEKKNECFNMEELEVINPPPVSTSLQFGLISIRAAMGELFATHFGEEFCDMIFDGASQKIAECDEIIRNKCKEPTLLFVALKRK